eukprot:g845.t1
MTTVEDGSGANAEIEKLNKQLAASREQVVSMGAENDWLAARVAELESENEALKLRVESAAPAQVDAKAIKVDDELLQPGSGVYPTATVGKLEKWHDSMNLLCVSFVNSSILASGGVDRAVRVANWSGQEALGSETLSAPVLALDSIVREDGQTEILAACMDGSHHVLAFNGSAAQGERLTVIQSFKDHTKYTIAARWSGCGAVFATASHDKTVGIYKRVEEGGKKAADGEAAGPFAKLQTFYFNGCAEALVFLPYAMSWGSGSAAVDESGDGSKPQWTLMVSARDDNYFHFVDGRSLEKTRMNMNEGGDDHVSYTVMDLALSPNGKYVLAATDKHRHILFRPGAAEKLRNFYGHTADSFSQPRVAWDPTGKYVFSNSQKDGLVYVWDVASEKVVAKLAGHTATVRGISCCVDDEGQAVLASASYDKSIRLWKHGSSGHSQTASLDGADGPPPPPRRDDAGSGAGAD